EPAVPQPERAPPGAPEKGGDERGSGEGAEGEDQLLVDPEEERHGAARHTRDEVGRADRHAAQHEAGGPPSRVAGGAARFVHRALGVDDARGRGFVPFGNGGGVVQHARMLPRAAGASRSRVGTSAFASRRPYGTL